ncbi:MAG: Chemotaxis protein CheY [Candidatus Omnitrophica bacterium]|nr:Chemotaxis protein CheY [Candidatus Omnitrophota bacterium]
MSRRLLLVDDEADIRMILKFRLERSDYHVETACDGQEALEWLRREAFDVVLTDLKMPIMDGVELYHTIKADPRLRTIPVLIMTATAERYTPQVLAGVGEGMLLKPFEVQDLLQLIDRVLR